MALGFFGREDELREWQQILADPRGQVVLVTGHSGMGKTELLQKMASMARECPDLICGAVREEVTKTDSVSSVLQLLLDRAFEAAGIPEGSFDGRPRAMEQWRALLNIFSPFKIGDLVKSLMLEPAQNARAKFVKILSQVSEKIPENGRAVIMIDPEKYLQADSDQDWSIVAANLPKKVKLVFAQRPDDILPNSAQFMSHAKTGVVVRVPPGELGVLDEAGFHQLLDSAANATGRSAIELEGILARYDRHPYAVAAAVEILRSGTNPADLPADPSGISEWQLQRVKRAGADAIRIFEAYSVFDVAIPEEVVDVVAGVAVPVRKALLADPYLGSLFRSERNGQRIYHAMLQEHIEGQITPEEKKGYHRRAVAYFREILRRPRVAGAAPDTLAVEQLPEHVIVLDGPVASAIAINDECLPLLRDQNNWDRAISLGSLATERCGNVELPAAFLAMQVGHALTMRERFDEAERELQKAARLFGKLRRGGTEEREANRLLGWAYLAKHARDHNGETLQKAEAAASRAHEGTPGVPWDVLASILELSAAVAARKGAFPEALDQLDRAIEIGTDARMIAALRNRRRFLGGRKVPPPVPDFGSDQRPNWSDPNHTCSQCGSYFRHPFAGSHFAVNCSFGCPFCGSMETIDHYFGSSQPR